jgi:hypothetical protein
LTIPERNFGKSAFFLITAAIIPAAAIAPNDVCPVLSGAGRPSMAINVA